MSSWPRAVGREAFSAYAKTRGWTDEEVSKAWAWLISKQCSIDAEKAAALRASLAEKEAAKRASEVEACTCCRCRP